MPCASVDYTANLYFHLSHSVCRVGYQVCTILVQWWFISAAAHVRRKFQQHTSTGPSKEGSSLSQEEARLWKFIQIPWMKKVTLANRLQNICIHIRAFASTALWVTGKRIVTDNCINIALVTALRLCTSSNPKARNHVQWTKFIFNLLFSAFEGILTNFKRKEKYYTHAIGIF